MTSKERLETGNPSFDEFDSWSGDFGNEDASGDGRSPRSPIRKGVMDGLKDHLTDPRAIREYVGKSLPRQYGELYDDYESVSGEVRNAINDVKQTAQAPINELARNLQERIPTRFKRLRSIVDKVEGATRADSWHDDYDPRKAREEAMLGQVRDVFGEFQDRMEEDAQARDEVEQDRFAREYLKTQTQVELQSKIARGADHQVSFARGVQLPFMKKSLELQFRAVGGITDLVTIMKGLTQQQRRQLDDITQNTKLPDIQKLRLSENYRQNIRNKFINATLGTFDGESSPLNKMVKTLGENLRDAVSMAMMGVDQVNMGMGASDFDEDEDDSAEGIKRRRAKQAVDWISKIGPDTAGWQARKRMRKMPGVTKAVFDGARDIGYMRNNLQSELQNYAYGGNFMSRDSWLRDIVGMSLPGRDVASDVKQDKGDALREAAYFDKLSRRALVEVIPGYLARMLQEQQIARTGNASVDLTLFDYNKGKFETRGSALANLRKATHAVNTQTASSMNDIVEEVKRSGGKLTDEQADDLRRALARGRKTGRSMTARSLSRAGFYQSVVGKENADALAQAMRQYLNTDELGKFTNERRGTRARNRLFEKLAESDFESQNTRAKIQQLFDQGQGELAYDAGWMTEEGKMNINRIVDTLAGVDKGFTQTHTVQPPTQFKEGGEQPARPPVMGAVQQPIQQPAPKVVDPWIEQQKLLQSYRAKDEQEQLKRMELSLKLLEEVQTFHADANTRLDQIVTELRLRIEQADVFEQQTSERGYRMPDIDFSELMASLQVKAGQAASAAADAASELQEKAAPAARSTVQELRDKFKEKTEKLRSRFAAKQAQEPEASQEEQAPEEPEEAPQGRFYNRSIKSNLMQMGRIIKRGAGKLYRGGRRVDRVARRVLFGDDVGYIQGTKEAAKKSRIMGARYFKDFKDGLPEFGDVFIQGADEVAITARDLASGKLRDASGKMIDSLAALADAAGDIYDENGEVVLSKAELVKSYVKVNGEILKDVWTDRLRRAFHFAKNAIERTRRHVFHNIIRARDIAKQGAAFARSVLAPPKDIYVKGEESPRLFAYLMKAGYYFNKIDGSAIAYPTDIKGPVVDRDGNEVVTHDDFIKGLVDVEGMPIRNIKQRIAEHVRTNITRTRGLVNVLTTKAIKGAKTAASLGSTFLSRGLTGVMSGTWKNSATGTGGPASPLEGLGNATEAAYQDRSILLLTEIRDVLYATLMPRKGMFKKMRKVVQEPQATKDTSHPNRVDVMEPSTPEPASRGRMNSIDALASGVAGMFGTAVSMGKRAFSRFRRRRGGVQEEDTNAPASETDPLATVNIAEQEKEEEVKADKRESRRERRRERKRALEEKRKAKTADTTELRKGSVEEQQANYVNKNAATKTLDDVVMPDKYERQNTFDLIAKAIKAGLSGIGGMLGDLLDAGGDLLDRGKDGKGGGRGGKVPKGGGGAGGGKRGIFRRLGRFMLGDVPGSLERGKAVGGAMNTARKAAVATKGFLGRRLVTPALSALGAVMGSSVLGPLAAVAGVVWTMKEVYDLFDTRPTKVGSKTLEVIRIAEYGFSSKDISAAQKMLQLEQVLKDSIRESKGHLELDKNHIDVAPIMVLFGIDKEDTNHLKRFLQWFNERFTPTYLKWMGPARAVRRDLAALDDMDSEQREKVLQATSAPTGWDIVANPFGGADLVMMTREVNALREAAMSLYRKNIKTAKDTGIPETMTKEQAVRATLTSAKEQSVRGLEAQRDFNKLDVVSKLQLHNNSKAMASFTSEGAQRMQSSGLTALQSIRLRLYGYENPDMGNVITIRGCEQVFHDMIHVDNKGRASFMGDLSELYRDCAKYFGLSSSDVQSEMRWRSWVEGRFIPVYTSYRGQLHYRTGTDTEVNLERTIDAVALYEMAQAVAATPNVWNITVMPVKDTPANTNPDSIKPFVDKLRDAANNQKATEVVNTRAPVMTPENHRDQSRSPVQLDMRPQRFDPVGRMMPVKAQVFNTMPDVEAQPKTAGSVTMPEQRVNVPSSMPKAPGEIASGADGWRYLKAPSKESIENLNPEVKRLFLAMAQEYGELTQQKIQVNRGFVTYDEQAKEYAANKTKAAKPGTSNHEFGLAIDVNTIDLNRLEKLGLLRKYGFTRPVGGETWHLEPAGIQGDVFGLRKNPEAAAKAVAGGVGQGGGGVGATKGGFRFGGRDPEAAKKMRLASNDAPETKLKDPVDGNRLPGMLQVSDKQAAASSIASPGVRSDAPVGQSTAIPNAATTAAGAPVAATAGATASATPAATAPAGGFAASAAPRTGDKVVFDDRSRSTSGKDLYSSLPEGGNKESNKKLVEAAAKGVGLDPRIGMTTVAIESGFRHDASSGVADGLMQFTDGTWNDTMKKYAKEYGIPSGTPASNAKANALLGSRFIKDNLDRAAKSGATPGMDVAYTMHFLGPNGGQRALKLPDDANMVKEFPGFAKHPVNKPLFFNSDGTPRTKAQFMEAVNNKVNRAANDFGIELPPSSMQVASVAPAANEGKFKAIPGMANKPAPAPERTTVAFSDQGRSTRSSTTGPGPLPPEATFSTFAAPQTVAQPMSQVQSELIKSIKDGTDIASEQLSVLTQILEKTTEMVTLLSEQNTRSDNMMARLVNNTVPPEKGQGTTPKVAAKPVAAGSRAQRSMEQVSKPYYRTA